MIEENQLPTNDEVAASAKWLQNLEAMIEAAPDDGSTDEAPYAPTEPQPMALIDQIAQIVANDSLYGFPTRYAEELENDQWFATFKAAKAVVERGGNALLCGTRGGGKTRMAYEVARRAVLPRGNSKPRRVFKTAMRIFLEIRSTYRRDSKESELDIIDHLATCRLLVIDEVQERAESTFEAQKLTSIIDDRYRHKLPTILIANLSPESFRDALGPSICDRCNENGGLLEFTWPSFRK
jgi:DNA replication protein DnaC